MSKFSVTGGIPLKGEVKISGSKNATLPILAASLLCKETCTLNNVPDISDVHQFIKIMQSLGAEVIFKNGTVTVNAANLKPGHIDEEAVKHMRSSILLLGPLLGRFKEAKLAFPGGCVLGKRSIHAHIHALQSLRVELIESDDSIHLKTAGLHAARFIMAEASVTATENAIMAAVMTEGTSEIRWAAMEPHVTDLCNFLMAMGADIHGLGTHTLTVHGGKELHAAEYSVTPDYLEAGTLAMAAVLTKGEVSITNCPTHQLDSFWQKLEEVGAKFTCYEDKVDIHPHNGLLAVEKLQTAVFPGFPTDLQAPFAVLLTQCEGTSMLFETLFDGRLSYLSELQKMGASTEVLNSHQAKITGPTKLKAAIVNSCDIRAGAAMILAALIADGQSTITDINYIDRGYEKIEEKLRSIGAQIVRG